MLACTGDIGTQNYRHFSPYVMGVGGTTLSMKAGPFGVSYAGETTWTITPDSFLPPATLAPAAVRLRSSPSRPIKTAYGINNTGGFRASPDVSMDASSLSPAYFDDSYDFHSPPVAAYCYGTSLATPMWAGILTIANQGLALEGKGVLANAQEAVYQAAVGGLPRRHDGLQRRRHDFVAPYRIVHRDSQKSPSLGGSTRISALR